MSGGWRARTDGTNTQAIFVPPLHGDWALASPLQAPSRPLQSPLSSPPVQASLLSLHLDVLFLASPQQQLHPLPLICHVIGAGFPRPPCFVLCMLLTEPAPHAAPHAVPPCLPLLLLPCFHSVSSCFNQLPLQYDACCDKPGD